MGEKEKVEELRADEEHRQQREFQQEQARQRRQKKLEAEQQERALEHAKQILAQKVRLARLHHTQQSVKWAWRSWLFRRAATELLEAKADGHHDAVLQRKALIAFLE